MPDSLDRQLAIADLYADALFELAQEQKRVDEVRHELTELVRLAEIEPGFGVFMTSDALDDDHREAGLEKMFRGRLSDMVLNTLQVMNRNGRHGLLGPLLQAYELRRKQAEGLVDARVVSAVELDSKTRADVEKTIADVSRRRPVVEYVVDPGVLGGLVVQVGDLRFENSLRRRLEIVHDSLVDRGLRGLEVGTTD